LLLLSVRVPWLFDFFDSVLQELGSVEIGPHVDAFFIPGGSTMSISGTVDIYRDTRVNGTLRINPGGLLRFHPPAVFFLDVPIVVNGVLEIASFVGSFDLVDGTGSVILGGSATWSGGLGTNVTLEVTSQGEPLRSNDTSLGPGTTLIIHSGALAEMSGSIGTCVSCMS
jgi:hypothetical protein